MICGFRVANVTITSSRNSVSCGWMFFRGEPTSKDSEVEDLFEYVEIASACDGVELAVGGLGVSPVSPLGSTPSANHTLLCSRVRHTEKGERTTVKHHTVMQMKTVCRPTSERALY